MSKQMFKAWDNKNKEWLTNFIINHHGEIMQILVKLNDAYTLIKIDATLCRSTGLKDSKRTKEFQEGEMIFEFDIVKADEHKPEYYKIAFVDGAFCATRDEMDGYCLDMNHFYPSIGCQIEKVGSIFEHKHLLDDKQWIMK